MITISCNKCSRTLELDDAFAGGVCRCGTCGAIQHVPRELRPASAGPVEIPSAAPPPIEPAPASQPTSRLLIVAVAVIVLLLAAVVLALLW